MTAIPPDTLQKTGSDGGRWYQAKDGDAFLLTGVPCSYKSTKAGKDYACAACGKPIAKGDDHWAGQDHRHIGCEVPQRKADIGDARERGLLPGFSAIKNQRKQNELMRYREFNCALHGIRLGARPPAGCNPAENAEILAVQACQDFNAESEKLMDDGTECHAAIAKWIERKGWPENPRWAKTCGQMEHWLRRIGVEALEDCYCEVPMADNGLGYGGTADLIAITAKAILLIDHKTKSFADIRRRLATMKKDIPFHVKPWLSDSLQQAAYTAMLTSPTAAIGQAANHARLREALTCGKPVLKYQNYIDRETGETWQLDWQEERLPWQKPGQRIHRGFEHASRLFNVLRLSWFVEENYTPPGVLGYDEIGRPMPGELAKMAEKQAKEDK